MSAVVSFMNESVVESLRGAYKLRKSYQLLHKLFDMIVAADRVVSQESSTQQTKVVMPEDSDNSDDDEFVDATDDITEISLLPESIQESMEATYISNGQTHTESISVRRASFTIIENRSATSSPSPSQSPVLDRRTSIATVSTFLERSSTQRSDQTLVDVSVYTGTLLAYGTIMLVISLLPPSLSRLLSIIGFRGSRSQALSILWKATSEDSPFGGLATFVLGSYYGNIVQNSDIVGEEFLAGKNPGTLLEKLHGSIVNVRKRYPGSALWVVEEVSPRLQKKINIGSYGKYKRQFGKRNSSFIIGQTLNFNASNRIACRFRKSFVKSFGT